MGGSNTAVQISTRRLILASFTFPQCRIWPRLSERVTSTLRLTQLSPLLPRLLLSLPPSPLCSLQVMYSQDKHSRPSVVETNTTSLELSLPVNQDYVIQIKPFSEGGEGSSSRQITIPKIAGGAMQRNWSAEK